MKEFKYIIAVFIIAILAASPFWMRLNFSTIIYAVPDSFFMLPMLFWPFIIALIALLFSLVFLTKDFRPIPIVIAFIFIAFPIIQWPTVLGWDQFLHSGIANNFSNGVITSGYSTYGVEYPGSYALLTYFGGITRLGYFYSAIVCSIIVKILTLALIYSISKKILSSANLACLVLAVFLLGNFRFTDYFQFSPQAFAFTLLLLLFYFYLRKPATRSTFAISTVLVIAISLTHLFTGIFTISFFLMSFLLTKFSHRAEKMLPSLLLLSMIVFFTWQVFGASSIFQNEGIVHFGQISSLSLNNLLDSVLSFGRGVSNVLLSRYSQLFLFLVGVGGIIGSLIAYRKKESQFLIGFLLGVVLFSIILVLLSEPPERVWLDRVVFLGFLSPTILSIYALNTFKRRTFLKVLPFICVILIPLSFFTNFDNIQLNSIKTWETSATNFVATSSGPPIYETSQFYVSSDSISLILLSYSGVNFRENFTYTGYTMNRFTTNPLALVTEESFLHSDVIIMSDRQKTDWYYSQGINPIQWANITSTLEQISIDNLVYNNGYVQVYYKTK